MPFSSIKSRYFLILREKILIFKSNSTISALFMRRITDMILDFGRKLAENEEE